MQDLLNVEGKIACVTGASSGLGREAALLLARRGARVVGVARRQDQLDSLCAEAEGDLASVRADLADRAAIAGIVGEVSSHFGAPDILINAAGINTRAPADDADVAQWDLTLNVNLAAPFFLAQAMVPAMAAKGWGRIVNFASLQSRRAFANGILYGASKGGVEQLTRAMAEAWSDRGITTNAIAPGFFPTELTQPVFNDAALAQKNASQTCIGRNGTPQDLHGPLLFFCSEASAYVTGHLLFVDGGFTAK